MTTIITTAMLISWTLAGKRIFSVSVPQRVFSLRTGAPRSFRRKKGMPERGYSVTGLDPDRTVKCSGRQLRISPKASVELCRTIRGMKLPDAKRLLERVIELKQAVAYRRFHKEVPHRRQLNEHFSLELKRAGYSHVELTKSPVGKRVVIYAAKPGMVIGRRGQSIRDLTKVLEEKFHIENPQLSVANIDVPEQDPKVVASQVSQALQRGVHFRRAAYWAIQRVMESQALGVEITIRGKLTTERSRFEKFRAGYLPRVGDPVLKSVKTAVADVQLKQGLFGINVRILPPQMNYIDKPIMLNPPADTTPPTVTTAKEAEPVAMPVVEVEVETVVGDVPVVVEDKEEEETGDSEKA